MVLPRIRFGLAVALMVMLPSSGPRGTMTTAISLALPTFLSWSTVRGRRPRSSSHLTALSSIVFGQSVALRGETAFVGAWGDENGSVYIFRHDGNGNWIEIDRLSASDGADGDRFGWQIAVTGPTLLVAANFDDDNGARSGSAYVFEESGGQWTSDT